MTEEEKKLSIVEENALAAEEPEKKTGLMRGARDFFENTFATLKGKDMNQAVEEFTGEMTLVVEGLSEDLVALRQQAERTAAQLTLTEEKLLRKNGDCRTEISELQDTLKQNAKQADALEKRIEALEKAQKAADKKPQKMGLGAILRQATWMVGIICAAWVIVTVLKLIGG